MSSVTPTPPPAPPLEAVDASTTVDSSIAETTTTAAVNSSPVLQNRNQHQQPPHFPRGTKVVEIANGRQFVSRPLDPRLLNNSNNLTSSQAHQQQFPIQQQQQPQHYNNIHRFHQQQHVGGGPHPVHQHSRVPFYQHSSSFSRPQQQQHFDSNARNTIQPHYSHRQQDQHNHFVDYHLAKVSSMDGSTRSSFHQGSQSARPHVSAIRHQEFQPQRQQPTMTPLPHQPFNMLNNMTRQRNDGVFAVGKPFNLHDILGHRSSGHRSSGAIATSSSPSQQPIHPTPTMSMTQQLHSLFQRQSSPTASSSSPVVKPLHSTGNEGKSTPPLMKLLETNSNTPSVTNAHHPVQQTNAVVTSTKPQSSSTTNNAPTSVSEMLAAAAGFADSNGNVTHQRRPTSDSTKGSKSVDNKIQWLFDAAAANPTSSRNNTNATQSPSSSLWTGPKIDGSPTLSISAVSSPLRGASLESQFVEDVWEFNRTEDVVDDQLLFRREELQRRRNPRYLAKTKRLHDLHIVMPICIPYGKIVVDDPLGANYYQFSSKPKNAGAEILFGKGLADPSKKSDEDQENEKPTTETKGIKPVCDVWGSFLHVRLGTIYNLTASHMPIVADLFKRSFDQDLCKFYVPIAMDCRGVHPSSDDLISQRAGRPSQLIKDTKDGRKSTSERYETHAVPTSDNDIKRLRMLRRHLRQFALRLIHNLGFDSSSPPSSTFKDFNEHPIQMAMRMANEQPRPCIELHENCRAETIMNGSLKIVVREWSPLSDPEVFKRVWAGQLASPDHSSAHHSGVAAEVRSQLLEHKSIPSARVVAGELRLEHNHLRMVDPRWPEELVPGRRVADSCPDHEAPGPEDSQARFVFCSRVANPQFTYAYAEADGSDPRDAALACRLSALFKVHLARHPTAGVKSSAATTQAPSASHTPEAITNGTSTPTAEGRATPNAEASSSTEESQQPTTEERLTHIDNAAEESAEKQKQPRDNATGAASSEKKEPTQSPQQQLASSPQQQHVHKSITSLSELTSIPAAFVPVLPESRQHLISQYDKSEMPQLLQLMLHQASEAEKVISDQSALKSDAAFKVPLTTVACKYFLKGGCARGSGCYFLHPADPKLESKVDVRHIVPSHPKFSL